MNGEADYYWPSSAQFTAVLHAIQNHTNLHEQNELDRYQPIVKILCSSLSSNWFWASIILSSRLLGLVSTAGCCCRPPGRLDWHKANGFWERQSHQQILRPCHEGSFFEYVHQGNCNAAKQQLKLPRSLTVFAIFCQSSSLAIQLSTSKNPQFKRNESVQQFQENIEQSVSTTQTSWKILFFSGG